MDETPQRKEKIATTMSSIADVVAVKIEELGREDDLPARFNFREALPHLQRMQDVIGELHDRDISALPISQLDHVIQACGTLMNLVTTIRQFDPNINSPLTVVNQLKQRIADEYDNVITRLLLPLAFTATKQANYTQIEREARGFHTQLKDEFESTKTYIDKAKKDAEHALEAVRAQAAEAGVSTNAHIFDQEARNRAATATQWRKWTIGMTITTGAVALLTFLGSLLWHYDQASHAIQYVAGKLIFLSVLTAATVWCAKNYRAQKHNETLNRHRAHALMTFQAFVTGTNDPHVSDAVLVQAAHAAFQGRPTGFESAAEATTQPPPLIDVFTKLANKGATTP